MRTIRVTGKGTLKVHPDMTRISINLSKVYEDYANTLRHSSEDTERIRDLLYRFGFDRSDLKTQYFNVDSEYESYYEKNERKSRFIGYRYSHEMKVEFESDNERLGKILYALAHCDLHPEFNLSYTVKDREAAKNELLGKAIKDAKDKAHVLSSAAGLQLKEIQSVDYSWGEINMVVTPMGRAMDMCDEIGESAGASYDMNIEPDDIEVSDTVTVVWEIV